LVECEHRILQGAMNLGENSWVIAHRQLVKVTQFSNGCINTRVPGLHIKREQALAIHGRTGINRGRGLLSRSDDSFIAFRFSQKIGVVRVIADEILHCHIV
jgi:hypothetical protein